MWGMCGGGGGFIKRSDMIEGGGKMGIRVWFGYEGDGKGGGEGGSGHGVSLEMRMTGWDGGQGEKASLVDYQDEKRKKRGFPFSLNI